MKKGEPRTFDGDLAQRLEDPEFRRLYEAEKAKTDEELSARVAAAMEAVDEAESKVSRRG